VIGRGFRVSTIFGIPIRVDLSWVLIVSLLTLNLTQVFGRDFPHLSLPVHIAMGLAASFLLFASVLAHELSHAVVALRCDVRIRGISLFIFGGAAEMEDEPPNASSELKIAVAGPAMSLVLAVGFLGIASTGSLIPASVQGIIQYLAEINILLVVFNVIPGFPLDGGRVLRSLLWGIWGDLGLATRTACAVGSGFGLLLMFLGFLAFLGPQAPFLGVWYIFIGMFLRFLARANYRQSLLRNALQRCTVRDFMREPLSVLPSATLEQVANRVFLKSGLAEIPVEDEGKLLGTLNIGGIRRVDRDLWGYTRVAEIMEAVPHQVSPDDEASCLRGLMSGADEVIPVVEAGTLVGLVTSRDLMKRLDLRVGLGGLVSLAGPGDQGDSEPHDKDRYQDREQNDSSDDDHKEQNQGNGQQNDSENASH
jgi:Zn-dependent protease/predicted transcriptional regulator